jgi:hypothetical protein
MAHTHRYSLQNANTHSTLTINGPHFFNQEDWFRKGEVKHQACIQNSDGENPWKTSTWKTKKEIDNSITVDSGKQVCEHKRWMQMAQDLFGPPCYISCRWRRHTGTAEVTPWGTLLLKELIVAQLVNEFPAFYLTQRFITVFTRACHWNLPRARSIQSTPSFSKFYFNARYMPRPSRPLWFYRPNNIWWRVQTMQFLITQISPASCHFIPLRSDCSPQRPVIKHFLCSL